MQVAVLKAYLQGNTKPKLVIHNLDLFSFVRSREIYDPAQYMPYLSNEAIYEAVSKIYPAAWKWKYLPLYGYLVEDMRFTWMKGLKALMGIQSPEDHFHGYVPRHISWTDDFEKFKQANAKGITFQIEPAGVEDMRAIAQLCRDYGVPLLFVYSPEYLEMQSLERNREEVFARFMSIALEFGVPLWDYSDAPIGRSRENFYNSQHLNAQGSTLFSADLGTRLLGPGLPWNP
jgi:hypothetical protein